MPFAVFQDTALQMLPFGSAIACPVFLLIGIYFLISDDKIKVIKYIAARPLFITLILLVLLQNTYNVIKYDYYVYNESLIERGLKMFILFGFLYYCCYIISVNDLRHCLKYSNIAFALTILGLIINLILGETWTHNTFFHYGVNQDYAIKEGQIFDYRQRGFSFESSTLGVTILITGIFCITVNKFKVIRYILGFILILALLMSDSKAIIPVTLLSFILVAIFSKSQILYKFTIPIIYLSILALCGTELIGYSVYYNLIFPFLDDIETKTSVATRLTYAINSVHSTIINPLGYSFTGYLPGLVENVLISADMAERLIGQSLNLHEVYVHYFQDIGADLGAKSFFFDNLLLFGVFFAIFWFILHYKLIKKLTNFHNKIYLFLLLIMFISLTFYASGVNMYIYSVGYGVLINKKL